MLSEQMLPDKCSPSNAPQKMLSVQMLPETKCSPVQMLPVKCSPTLNALCPNAPRNQMLPGPNALRQNAPRKKRLPSPNAPRNQMLPEKNALRKNAPRKKMLPETKCSPKNNFSNFGKNDNFFKIWQNRMIFQNSTKNDDFSKFNKK